MTFDEFSERVADDGDKYLRLVEMRGGCRCFICPPCSACSTPMNEREAVELGWEPEPDYMAEVRRLCR